MKMSMFQLLTDALMNSVVCGCGMDISDIETMSEARPARVRKPSTTARKPPVAASERVSHVREQATAGEPVTVSEPAVTASHYPNRGTSVTWSYAFEPVATSPRPAWLPKRHQRAGGVPVPTRSPRTRVPTVIGVGG